MQPATLGAAFDAAATSGNLGDVEDDEDDGVAEVVPHEGWRHSWREKRRRMSCCELIRATLIPWLAFVLCVSLFLFVYGSQPGLVWVTIAFCAGLAALAAVGGSIARHPVLVAISSLTVTSLALGAAIGIWLDAEYLQRFRELVQGGLHHTVDSGKKPDAGAEAAVLQFITGTSVDGNRSLGYLAQRSTFCVAPILPARGASKTVFYWAVGKNCCDRRGGFRCATSESSDELLAITQKPNRIFKRAIRQAASVYGLEASAAPTPWMVTIVEHPAKVISEIWHETVMISIMAVLMHLFVCTVATSTMATASAYGSKLD